MGSVKDKSTHSHSIGDVKQIRFGYQYRKYTTPPFTMIGINFPIGGGYILRARARIRYHFLAPLFSWRSRRPAKRDEVIFARALSSWTYKNAIVSDVYDDNETSLYTDTIRTDFLSGFGILSGMGLTLFKTKKLTLDIESRIGFVLYDLKTFERFDNDVFYPDVYVRFGVGLSFSLGYNP